MTADWVYVGGTFDLFHPGHVNLLRQARKIGPVVVAVNSDAFAERYKRRPVMTQHERIETVRACRYADLVVLNIGGEDSKITIEHLASQNHRVRYIVHGDDWVGPGLMQQMGLTHGWLAGKGIELRYVPYTAGVSSSDIEQRVAESGLLRVRNEVVCCGDPGDCSC